MYIAFYITLGMVMSLILIMIINKDSTLLISYKQVYYENFCLKKEIKNLQKKIEEHEACLNAYYEEGLKRGEE